jgi:hypothetical protein
MRILFVFILLKHAGWAQQTFIQLESTSQLPPACYDSLKNYSLILLGEMHGTNESPALVNAIARLFAGRNKKIIVALEIPDNEQSFINGVMRSGDTNLFRKSPFFKNIRDGRTSRAMANLLISLRRIPNATVACFDYSTTVKDQREGDSLMAVNVSILRKNNPQALVILLAGNIHTNIKKGLRENFETMGSYLVGESESGILSLDIRFLKGTIYNNTLRTFPEKETPYKAYLKQEGFVLIDPEFRDQGYHGIIYLREATPSFPYLD